MTTSNAINADSTGIQSYDGINTFNGRTITGTTNQITVSNGNGTAGDPTLELASIVINSTQPCVSAYKSANTTNVTGNGTVATVVYDTVIFDQGSNYNSGTGTFTAPVTGKYLVIAQTEFSNVGVVAYQFEVYINSTARVWTGANNGPITSASVNTRYAQISAIIDMSATNTFTISSMANGQGADTIGFFGDTKPLTYLSVCLLC